MSTKSELLKLLDSNCGSFVSGESLARELGISRAAVNKAAASLKKSGYDILSRPSQGYLLRDKVDLLTDVSVGSGLTRPCRLKVFDSLDSTNGYIMNKESLDEPVAIIANELFAAPTGSCLYLSLGLKPEFGVDQAPFLTMASALSIAGAIEEVTGLNPRIGWVDDLYYEGKKICRINTEGLSTLETGVFSKLAIGIQVFCFSPKGHDTLPEECGYISDRENSFSRSVLASRIIDRLLSMLDSFPSEGILSEYRRRCFILGKYVDVTTPEEPRSYAARVIDVDDNGGLVVEFTEGPRMREMVTLTSCNVALREI